MRIIKQEKRDFGESGDFDEKSFFPKNPLDIGTIP